MDLFIAVSEIDYQQKKLFLFCNGNDKPINPISSDLNKIAQISRIMQIILIIIQI
jgi:hypothetical protein